MNPSDPNTIPNPTPDQNQVPEPQVQPEAVTTQPAAQPMNAAYAAPAVPIQAAAVNPGKGLGIASLITSLLGIGLVGLILGIIGIGKSKKAGMQNGLALAGIIIGVLNMVIGLIILVVALNGVAQVANDIVSACANSATGVITLADGTSYTCTE